MHKLSRALPLLGLLALAGCSSTGTAVNQPVNTVAAPVVSAPALTGPSPAQQVAAAQTATMVDAYVDPAVLPMMSAKERADASSAQLYALLFGRPGAPRTWSGSGSSGSITVGPYVRVNNLDCRDFTNTVTVAGKPYVRKGTACHEVNGTWSVASVAG